MLDDIWKRGCLIGVLALAYAPLLEAKTNCATKPRKAAAGERAMRFEYEKIFDRGATPAMAVEKPLQRALEQLLEASEEVESPLNNVREIAAGKTNWPQDKAKQRKVVRELLIDYFNREGTSLVLLEEGKEGRGYAPERGEDLKKNWVFSLTIPTLSDHIYWIVVSREAPFKAYVYGFN